MTAVLLRSASSKARYEGRAGKVASLDEESKTSAEVKSGRVAVLLNGEKEPISFKLMNLRIDKIPPANITNLRILQLVAISFIGMYLLSCFWFAIALVAGA